MAQRINLGILYNNDENWIGGAYYIQNLIAALNTLPEHRKPQVTIFSKTAEEFGQIEKTGYEYLSYKPLVNQKVSINLFKRFLNKSLFWLIKHDLYPQPIELDLGIANVIFPAPIGLHSEKSQKKIYWIPDLQELYYPHFFSKDQIAYRMHSYKHIAKSADAVVFSSKCAMQDFDQLFPRHKCKMYVLRFAVTHPKLGNIDFSALKAKYQIRNDYFIIPNQFWKHKNQSVVIDAAKKLKDEDRLSFNLVFTGKQEDFRNPEYFPSLKQKVEAYGLTEEVKFLGFIDRVDQLQLIKGAIGLIQPSLFEGWSTVIEDGKALQKMMLVSDLPVHREQLGNDAFFFDPSNAETLADLLQSRFVSGRSSFDYEACIESYAEHFVNLIEDIL